MNLSFMTAFWPCLQLTVQHLPIQSCAHLVRGNPTFAESQSLFNYNSFIAAIVGFSRDMTGQLYRQLKYVD